MAELVSLKGKCKLNVVAKTSSSEKRKNQKYWYVFLIISKEQEQEADDKEVLVTFWESDFKNDQSSLDKIAGLKQGEEITVHGEWSGRDGNILKAKEIEDKDFNLII